MHLKTSEQPTIGSFSDRESRESCPTKRKNRKTEMYSQAKIDKDDHCLGVGERLNAAAIHARVEFLSPPMSCPCRRRLPMYYCHA